MAHVGLFRGTDCDNERIDQTRKVGRSELKPLKRLEKPESFVMIAVQADTPMLFSGTDEPVAFLELKSVGLPARKTKTLCQSLCELVGQHLGIVKERVYVKFIDVNHGMWGWKGDVF